MSICTYSSISHTPLLLVRMYYSIPKPLAYKPFIDGISNPVRSTIVARDRHNLLFLLSNLYFTHTVILYTKVNVYLCL